MVQDVGRGELLAELERFLADPFAIHSH